jgi:hypothetical protein
MTTFMVKPVFNFENADTIPMSFTITSFKGSDCGFYQVDNEIFFYAVGDLTSEMEPLEVVLVPEGGSVPSGYEIDIIFPFFYEDDCLWFGIAIKSTQRANKQVFEWKRGF